MRLIDADVLQEEFEWIESNVCECGRESVQDALERIKRAPTISHEDLPIVREMQNEIEKRNRGMENLCENIKFVYQKRDELRGKLEQAAAEKNAAINDLLQVGRGYDFCTVCAHCCEGGKPKYRHQEPYMEFCKKCNDDYSQFEWRGLKERDADANM